MQETNSNLKMPGNYRSLLALRDTEVAIKQVKDFFEAALARELNLTRVSAPLFVRPETGLNDNLNGVERPVAFDKYVASHPQSPATPFGRAGV